MYRHGYLAARRIVPLQTFTVAQPRINLQVEYRRVCSWSRERLWGSEEGLCSTDFRVSPLYSLHENVLCGQKVPHCLGGGDMGSRNLQVRRAFVCDREPFWQCRSSGGQSSASHRGGPGSNPGQVMWERHWAGFLWVLRCPLPFIHSVIHSFH
jgi:hypothetical protein